MDRGKLITTRKGALWREADGTLVEWDLSEVRVTRPWPLPRCWAKSPGPFGRWREVYGRVVPWVWKPDASTRVRSWAGGPWLLLVFKMLFIRKVRLSTVTNFYK